MLCLGVAVVGVTTLLLGFVYDIIYAGIPNQDPTPEMQASYDLHSSVAMYTMVFGIVLFLMGMLSFLITWQYYKRKSLEL